MWARRGIEILSALQTSDNPEKALLANLPVGMNRLASTTQIEPVGGPDRTGCWSHGYHWLDGVVVVLGRLAVTLGLNCEVRFKLSLGSCSKGRKASVA
jgi:hypothetical protein